MYFVLSTARFRDPLLFCSVHLEFFQVCCCFVRVDRFSFSEFFSSFLIPNLSGYRRWSLGSLSGTIICPVSGRLTSFLAQPWKALCFAVCTATDLDTFDHGLSQVEDRDVVIISVMTSILLEEVNQLEVASSAANVCEQSLSCLFGLCPTIPGCQVRFYFFSCLEVAEK